MDTGLHCPTCGYNLTGLPEDRCPECGNIFDYMQVASGEAFDLSRRTVVCRLLLGAAVMLAGLVATLATNLPVIALASVPLAVVNAILLARRMEWVYAGTLPWQSRFENTIRRAIRLMLLQFVFGVGLLLVICAVLALWQP